MIRKRAFTLIELLVVIAIIAILAAILFPVFAQAKASAKNAAALSNVKQLGLSHLMYATDNDDMFSPLVERNVGATNWPGSGGLEDGSGNAISGAWQSLIMPYVKNSQMFFHPMGPTDTPADWAFWQKEWQTWGVVPRALSLNINTNGAVAMVDGYYTNGVPYYIDGPFGSASGEAYRNLTVGNVPSQTQSSINNISDQIMIAEGTSYDFGWTRGSVNGSNLAVWCGSTFNANYNGYDMQLYPSGTMGTPVGRKNGGSGIYDCYYPTGLSTYVACDGSAHTIDVADALWGQTVNVTIAGNQVQAVEHMWVN